LPKQVSVGVIQGQLSPETGRLYGRAWARFAAFCTEHSRTALPASSEIVCAFLTLPGRGRADLGRYRAAIDHKHRQHECAPPGRDPAVRALLRSARRRAPRASKRALLSPAQLHRLAQSCPGDLAGRRDRALLLLAASGLGRAALVGLRAEQLRFSEGGITCVMAGTDGVPSIEVPRSGAIASCPVRALEDWLRVSATRYGPVFRKVNRWGQLEHSALGTDAIRLILARRVAGLR
jgi:integrase